MSAPIRILVVNPGSTSTKLGLFENEKPVAIGKVDHPAKDLEAYPRILDQVPMRRQVMLDFLRQQGLAPADLSAVVGRGGLLKPMVGGTYTVSARMAEDLQPCVYGEHASNIGGVLAYSFHKEFDIPAFIVDPVVVDEMRDIARYSGLKEIPRRSIWHALNIRAVIRQVCARENWDFNADNFVAVHLGGGISVVAMEAGRCVDVSNGLEAGPYTPERAGTLPSLDLAALCYSGKYTHAEMKKLIVGRGGLMNYLGTSNLIDIEKRIESGDEEAAAVLSGMAYQVAKEIGSYFAVLKGKLRAIVITGGAAHCSILVNDIKQYIESMGRVVVVPGEDELAALALGALRVLRGEEKARTYE
ncbi:MAG TPA: butyrate kinase [Candidatus Ozemobacteraceae bacterium]|nr:butyrate kinase [Candidatus Ozemobacteraceae bacterium]